MIQVDVNNLKAGMIVGQKVIGKYGMIFLSIGTKLTERNIERLKKLNINYIYIQESENDNHLSEKLDFIEKNINRKFQMNYYKTLNVFKSIYDDFSTINQSKLEEVKNTVNPLIDKFTKDNNILKNIRQIKVKDNYTYKHSMNVFILSIMIGKWMKYSKHDLEKLAIASLFHDIGKNKIPKEILNKPTRLSVEEFEIIKKHTIYGYENMRNVTNIYSDILCGILQHHERIDGNGYPFKLKGDEIHEFSKIISIADIFDAMTSKRVYKDKESPFKVVEWLASNKFGSLDPYICDVFLRGITEFYVGNIVVLNTGELGEIIMTNKHIPTKPLVKVNNNYIDLSTNFDYEIIDIIG